MDELFFSCEENLITDCKKKIIADFEMKNTGLMDYFLSLEVW
jgi:hypothetical protein